MVALTFQRPAQQVRSSWVHTAPNPPVLSPAECHAINTPCTWCIINTTESTGWHQQELRRTWSVLQTTILVNNRKVRRALCHQYFNGLNSSGVDSPQDYCCHTCFAVYFRTLGTKKPLLKTQSLGTTNKINHQTSPTSASFSARTVDCSFNNAY